MFKKFVSVQGLWRLILQSLFRFPLAILCAISISINIILVDFNLDSSEFWDTTRFIMSAYLCMLLSISSVLYSESRQASIIKMYLLQALISIISLIYFIALPTDFWEFGPKHITLYCIYIILAHLLVSFSAYTKTSLTQGFWQFNKILFLRFLTSALYTIVLYLGLAGALLAIDNLFDVDIKSRVYSNLWVIITGIFNTWFFLAGVPNKTNELQADLSYPKGLKAFTQFVLLPIVTIYLLILYAYGTKILAAFSLPKGWVSYLVIAFSVAGILSFLLIYPIRNHEENRWIKLFSKWFYIALYPLIILLGVAIFKRVIDYGITENRYFVLLIAFWLTFIATYFLISKKDNIKTIPISLFVIGLLSSFGPWGAFSTSENSQVQRLEKILIDHKILVNNKIDVHHPEIDVEVSSEISSIVHYLILYHSVDPIKNWFSVSLDSLLLDTNSIYRESRYIPYANNYLSTYEKVSIILREMNIKEAYESSYLNEYNQRSQYFNYSTSTNSNGHPMYLYGFDYLYDLNLYFNENDRYYQDQNQIILNNDTIKIVKTDQYIRFLSPRDNTSLLTFSLDSFFYKLQNEYTLNGYDLPKAKMLIQKQSDSLSINLYLNNISGDITYFNDKEKITFHNINGRLLIKKMSN